MNSIKEIIVDILVMIFIAFAVWLKNPWMWWVIAVYTALLIIAKGFVLYSDGFIQRRVRKNEEEPEWFLHFLYGVNVLLLGIAAWWNLLIGWVLIWLFSYLGQLKKAKK